MAPSGAFFHYRQQFSTSVALTAPWSIAFLVIVSAVLHGLALFHGNPSANSSLRSLTSGQGLMGGRYAIALIALVFGSIVLLGAPLLRLALVRMQWIGDGSSHLYRLRALKRTLGPSYVIFFVYAVVVAFVAHAPLVGLPWYDSAWRWISRAVFSWPGLVSAAFAGLSFTFKYLRPSAEARFARTFEPWTYGQLNLDVGAFGTESQEAARRLREYARARRDKASSSRAMRAYLLHGDAEAFSQLFRMRRRLSEAHRLALRRFGIGTDGWQGLTRLRTRLGRVIGSTKADSIQLTASTTSAIRLSLDLFGRGATTLVTTDIEHPVVLHMLSQFFGRQLRVETVALSHCVQASSELTLEAVIDQACERLRGQRTIWLMSHVDYATGGVFPLREMVARVRSVLHDATFIVDGAHGPGNTEVRVEDYGIDAYAFCGHKWLMGTPGSGFLWVAEKHRQLAAEVDFEGPSLSEESFSKLGRRSSLAMEPFFTCDAYLALLERVQVKEMLKHQHELQAALAKSVAVVDGIDLVALRIPMSSIVPFTAAPHLSLSIATLIEECERRYVLGGFFPERGIGRFCVPYFLDEYNIRNITAVLSDAASKYHQVADPPKARTGAKGVRH